MRLVVIYYASIPGSQYTVELLQRACTELGVELYEIDVETFRFKDLPTLDENDILYRVASGRLARSIEKVLINDKCKHFWSHWEYALRGRGGSFFYHEKYGLPSIATIPFIPRDRDEAAECAEQLGGFPLVVKATGGSKGVGVMKIDSLQSFVSICDYFRKSKAEVIIRSFVEHEYYGRFIVLGDKVVASNRTKVLDGDFRTNTTDNIEGNREPYVFPKEVQEMAVKAVKVLGLEFGGLDILFDAEGDAHIAEVNFPTQFSFAQDLTGIDVAKLMIEHAMRK